MPIKTSLIVGCLLLTYGCASPPPEPVKQESVFDQLERERKDADAHPQVPANAPRDAMYQKVRQFEEQSSDAQSRLLKGEDADKVLKGLGR